VNEATNGEPSQGGGQPASDKYGWERWRWDESLFQGTALFYRRGRTPYAPGLANAIAESLSLDGHDRLLDVGCGPGTICLRLAHLFESVTGLDPDRGMLDEARRAADEQHINNAHWIQKRAEALPAGLGSFRVITFAQSFHWMDRSKVAAAVRTMIEPNGAVVQIDPRIHDGSATTPAVGSHPTVPESAVDDLRRRYLGTDRRAGKSLRNTSPSGEDSIFQHAGFLPEERTTVPDGRILDRSVDDIVASVFAASSTAPHLFGQRLPEFEADLRGLLSEASPAGLFSVPLSDNEVRIRRPRTLQ